MDRKIDAMHQAYGVKHGEKCKSCCNFFTQTIGNSKFNKCVMYGISFSTSTDWSSRNEACMMHNVKFNKECHRPLLEIIKHQERSTGEQQEQLEGQISFY